ncbi:MAG: class I SAM-dependent methyltransferase [Actinobacteria bacterium]|nr:class I SAM-dependent methyltransferase [Actinomycetota bacterium]
MNPSVTEKTGRDASRPTLPRELPDESIGRTVNLSGRYRAAGKRMFERASKQNDANILRALASGGAIDSLLDLGCDDGGRTLQYAQACGAKTVHGVEVVAERAAMARARGVQVSEADLSENLPYADQSLDVVVSNQVIEHLFDTDLFVSEAFRVLKPGGYVVTSTENLASWHNVAALMLGWQPFSLSNVSSKGTIGNPFGLLAGSDWTSLFPDATTFQHRRVFATRGLVHLHESHGFSDVKCRGAGYYPLPRVFGRLNPGHAAFITVVGSRPLD